MDRPTVDDLRLWLSDQLAAELGNRYGNLKISLLSQATMVADGTTVLLLRDSFGQPRAVVLCSAPVSPDLVKRAMDRARHAKMILGVSAGAHILDPLMEGRVQGLSYVVLPYCNRLSESQPLWWFQRSLLRPIILGWLWLLTECTVRDVEPTAIDRSFVEPLRRMASLGCVNDAARAAAKRAAERLDAGAWTPRHVLMHGDLWKGNILIRPPSAGVEQRRWRDRFVIIDWAGAGICGYAIYDLVRLAQGMHLTAPSLRSEVDRHCRLLRCEPADASSYLLAALGHISMNLEHFPFDRYARMVESCLTTLERALEVTP